MTSTGMESTRLTIDDTRVPAELSFGPTFNAATWFVDRHIEQGRADRIAIVEAGDPGRRITYGTLAELTNRAGNALRESGAAPGDRVLMVVKDCAEFFYLFWGAVKAGLIPVPVNVMLRTDDLAFMIADSEATLVVYSPEFAPEVVPALLSAATGAQGLVLDDEGGLVDRIAEASPDLEAVPGGPDAVAFWLYSSGTTGRPKGVVHHHGHAPCTCQHYAVGVLGMTEDDVCFSAAKLFFAYGLGNGMTFPLHVGGTAILDERRPTPASTFDTISTHRPTMFFGVPTLYAAQLQALDSAADAPDCSSLRVCVSAGEALPADLFRRWRDRTGLEILDGIGSTEALHIFISNAPGAVRPGTTGTLVPGYDARVVGSDGVEVGADESGQLEIRGGSITSGYWNRPDRTGDALVDGWLRTGDQYARSADGYFRYLGRADDMLKVGGIWCSPFDIEARLIEHPAVLEAAVVGRPDEDDLVKPEAFVVLADGAPVAQEMEATLVRHCREGLPPYMYPRWIHFLDDLPKTATGKIQRFRLRG